MVEGGRSGIRGSFAGNRRERQKKEAYYQMVVGEALGASWLEGIEIRGESRYDDIEMVFRD